MYKEFEKEKKIILKNLNFFIFYLSNLINYKRLYFHI